MLSIFKTRILFAALLGTSCGLIGEVGAMEEASIVQFATVVNKKLEYLKENDEKLSEQVKSLSNGLDRILKDLQFREEENDPIENIPINYLKDKNPKTFKELIEEVSIIGDKIERSLSKFKENFFADFKEINTKQLDDILSNTKQFVNNATDVSLIFDQYKGNISDNSKIGDLNDLRDIAVKASSNMNSYFKNAFTNGLEPYVKLIMSFNEPSDPKAFFGDVCKNLELGDNNGIFRENVELALDEIKNSVISVNDDYNNKKITLFMLIKKQEKITKDLLIKQNKDLSQALNIVSKAW